MRLLREGILVRRQLERGADPVVGVETDAVAITGEDEEEVERALGVAQGGEEALVEEPVGEEGKATLDAADAVGAGWRPVRWPSVGVGGHLSLRRRRGAAPARGSWRSDPRRARGGDVLAIAGTIDVDPEGVRGEPVEDGGGERGIAEVPAPVAERDVGRHGGRGATVAAIDQVVEGVGGGGLVPVLLDLAAACVVDDQEFCGSPRREPLGIGAVGEPGMEIVEQVDAAGVA